MRDVLNDLLAWWRAGQKVGLATVVRTWRSAPRPAGATMAVGPDGTVVGSVSGGCVEGAVYDLCNEVIQTGRPRVDGPEDQLGSRLLVWTDRHAGSLGSARLDAAAANDARGLLAAGRTGTLHYGPDGQRQGDALTLFVASYAPPARMIVFGAIDFAASVAQIGTFLGYNVTVCDARPVFATPKRFPSADQVVVDWPHRYLRTEIDAGRTDNRTVVCVLTHDPKFDVPVLQIALRQNLAYVGAMGSRRTHNDRLTRLRAAGLTDQELQTLSSPIGLDLGARTPEETAISIASEIIAARWGGTGARLTTLPGRIHHD